MHRNALLLQAASCRVLQALSVLRLPYRVEDDDVIVIETDFGWSFRLFVSPNGAQYFRNRHGHRHRCLSSSRHYVISVWPNTTVEKIAEIISRYIASRKRGYESEEIAAAALEQVRRKRSNLIADAYKTGSVADAAGADFRVGIHLPTPGRIFWIGLEVKSSLAGLQRVRERWSKNRSNAGPELPETQCFRHLRRVIVVPQGGTREERISLTAERIIHELELVLRKVA